MAAKLALALALVALAVGIAAAQPPSVQFYPSYVYNLTDVQVDVSSRRRERARGGSSTHSASAAMSRGHRGASL